MALKHYGWRNELFSIYPNAVSLRVLDGPNASKGIPFVSIIVLTLFLALVYAVWVRWRRFRDARVNPALERMEEDLSARQGRLAAWWRDRRKGG